MFIKTSDARDSQLVEGVRMKPLAHGERTLLCEFHLEKASRIPAHRHPHEQTGYLVSGRLRLITASETFDAAPGDSWCIPADVEHSGHALEDSVAVEVFSPVRQEYLESVP
jgi:quercetin dioxygenase-like cupin family protein